MPLWFHLVLDPVRPSPSNLPMRCLHQPRNLAHRTTATTSTWTIINNTTTIAAAVTTTTTTTAVARIHHQIKDLTMALLRDSTIHNGILRRRPSKSPKYTFRPRRVITMAIIPAPRQHPYILYHRIPTDGKGNHGYTGCICVKLDWWIGS